MTHRIPSRVAAIMGLLAVATVVVAGCGQAFSLTGGTGGGGGGGGGASVTGSTSGGTTSSSGATSSASSTGSGSVGCNWSPSGMNPCKPGQYCDDTSCGQTMGAGTCKYKEIPKSNDNPVCGCDGLTYWNNSVASSRGMPAQHNVACPKAVEKPCTSTADCPPGLDVHCRTVNPGCDGPLTGACWVLPLSCDGTTEQVRGCPDKNCIRACDLIKLNGNYDDQTCN